MYNNERAVDERRIQKVGDNVTTTKTSKISLNTIDVKWFYVKNIKSYPYDENLYLFKRNLVNKIKNAPIELLIKIGLKPDKDKDLLICETDLRIKNVKELSINDDRKYYLLLLHYIMIHNF